MYLNPHVTALKLQESWITTEIAVHFHSSQLDKVCEQIFLKSMRVMSPEMRLRLIRMLSFCRIISTPWWINPSQSLSRMSGTTSTSSCQARLRTHMRRSVATAASTLMPCPLLSLPKPLVRIFCPTHSKIILCTQKSSYPPLFVLFFIEAPVA